MGRLEGKVAVVTGAGSGIGRASAVAFAKEGARVFGLDRNAQGLAEMEDEIGPAGTGLVVDVSSEPSVREAFARIGELAGRVDVLFNCAAVQFHDRDNRAHELSLETWNETIAVNLTGAFLCCKHAIPLMLPGGGSIINCGSPTGIRGSAPGYDAYSTAKGGMMAFTRVLAMDYAADGIRVNTIVPGATETPLIKDLLADPDTANALLAKIPLGRFASPEDYVGIAVFAASDESAYTTGATLLADGGVSEK
ncbi:MAG: SDR family NAD(P)-dependent oxidoreductase [Aeromicrobium sp.]